MSNLGHKDIGALINSRIEIALKRADESPKFLEYIGKHSESSVTIDELLQKLNEDERIIIRRYNDNEITKEIFELNEAYLQGLRDCIQALSVLGSEEGVFFGE